MVNNPYTPGWYGWIKWFADGLSDLAKDVSDMSYDMEDMMNENSMRKMEPDKRLLVKLFILSEAMEDEKFKEAIDKLKNNFNDVYEMRHRPWLLERWGLEDEYEDDDDDDDNDDYEEDN